MRAKALTAALVAVVTTVGLWSAPVHAAEEGVPGGFASWDELFATQLKMIQAADVVTAAAVGTEGLAGISAKPERREVWVYWKGDLPATVASAVAKARALAPVQVKPARFSRAELQVVAAEVARLDGVTVVGPLGDGSGLRVSTVDDRALAAVRDLAAVSGAAIPLTAKPSRPVLAGRQNSTAPHYGGAAFTQPVDGGFSFCTTGFAINHPRAGKRMLTAGHCGANGDTVYNGTTVSVMGTVSGDNNAKDTMLINTTEGGRVYADGFNSSTSKPVLMAFGSYEDTLVCTSGAMTGEHCKIRITNTGLTIDIGPYNIGPVVEAVHDDELPAAGEGDSGGPVVSQDSHGVLGMGDFVNVYAQGTISAIDLWDEVPCVGMYDTVCSFTMFYVDIMDSLAYYNSTIATG